MDNVNTYKRDLLNTIMAEFLKPGNRPVESIAAPLAELLCLDMSELYPEKKDELLHELGIPVCNAYESMKINDTPAPESITSKIHKFLVNFQKKFEDKLAHIAIGVFIFVILNYLLVLGHFIVRPYGFLIGSIVTILIASYKEYRSDTTPDIWDLIATYGGFLLATLIRLVPAV